MKKSTKAAVATGTAAFLLLGGAGTVAFWSDSDIVDGGSVTSGSLTLDAVGCDAEWVHTNGSAIGDDVVTIVPGDVITKDCTFTVGAVGDNLEASLTTPDTVEYDVTPTPDAETSTLSLDVDAAYVLGGDPVATVTEADNGETLTATLTVTFPFGDVDAVNANDTQEITAALEDLTVSLEQDANTATPTP